MDCGWSRTFQYLLKRTPDTVHSVVVNNVTMTYSFADMDIKYRISHNCAEIIRLSLFFKLRIGDRGLRCSFAPQM